MWDNELYVALMEGRMPLRINLEQDGDEWVGTHDQWGVDVTVRDPSIRMAQEGVRDEVLRKIRNGEFTVKFG